MDNNQPSDFDGLDTIKDFAERGILATKISVVVDLRYKGERIASLEALGNAKTEFD